MPSLSTTVLRLRDFRLLLLTRLFGQAALQSQAVIVGWQVYAITHSPFMLGLVGLTEAVPAILCALIAGHIVDISRPQKVYMICMGILVLNTCMLFLTAGGFIVPVHDALPWLFAGVFISGLARSFNMPASFSLLPRVVARSEISAASAWMNSFFNVAAIGGPAVAGVVYGAFGARVAWCLPTVLMLVGFLTIAQLHTHHEAAVPKREPAWASIRAGWAFIFQTPVILGVMLLDMFAVLFGGAVAMLPAYADQVLHVGPEGLGALRAAPAIGAVTMALILAIRPLKRVKTTTMLWCVVGFGFCMIGFGLSTLFWLSMVLLALSGGFDCVSVVIRATITQLLTPNGMMGRVSSVKSMFVISSNEIGAFESGTAAQMLGLVPSVVIGGIATLAIAGLTALLFPQMRNTVVVADEILETPEPPSS